MRGIPCSASHAAIRLHVPLLVLALRLAAVLALQEGLAVLVELQLGDDDFRRTDANLHGLSVRLVARHTLNVNDPLLAVDSRDLSLTVMVVAASDLHLVVLANRNGTHVVLLAKLLG